MDYQSMNYDYFEHAMKPKDVREETAQWTKIRSYVYVIRKKFNPYQMAETTQERKQKLNTKLNLFKIGMSSVATANGKSKGGVRLSNLRTGLINFDVFRIFLYPAFPMAEGDKDTDGRYAKIVEGFLHSLIDQEFQHKGVYRIEFRGNKGVSQVKSEWFAIPEKMEKQFLAFVDNAVYADQGASVVNAIKPFYGTGFEKKSVFNVLDRLGTQPLISEVRPAKKSKLTKYQQERNRNIRKTANIYRRTAEQIESDMRRKEVAKAQAALDKKHGEEMAQDLEYWKKELIDKQFTLKKGEQLGNSYKNKYLTKVVTDVIQSGKNFYAIYEPFMRLRRKLALDPQVLKEESGPFRVNELLDYFPQLLQKKKNKIAYDYFNRINHRNPDIDYGAELLPG